jgi:thymidylate synthase (FAD)
MFEGRIDRCAKEYDLLAATLGISDQMEELRRDPSLSRVDLRKRMNQAARSCLPNEVEAPIVATANLRAWRHFLEMRCSRQADVQIRILAYRIYLCLRQVDQFAFDDYVEGDLPDGTKCLWTDTSKV